MKLSKNIKQFCALFLSAFFFYSSVVGQLDLTMIPTNIGCTPNSLFSNSYSGQGTINLINNGNLNFIVMPECISDMGIGDFPGTCYSTNLNATVEWTCNGLYQIVNLGDALDDWPYRYYWKWLGQPCCLDQLEGSDFYGGYLEIDFYSKNTGAGYYRYIKWDLLDPLVEGMEYTFQMGISPFSIPSTSSTVHVSNIGIAFESDLPNYGFDDDLLYLGDQITPDFEIMGGSLVNAVQDPVQFQFTGNGENYIIIGIFEPEGSLQFGSNTNANSEAKYLLDNVRLFRTGCPNPIARFDGNNVVEEYHCPGEEIEFTPYSGTAPYVWTIDGVVQNDTDDVFTFIADEDYHYVTFTCDTGICTTTDTAYIFPQIFHHQWPADSILSCGFPVEFEEDFYLENLQSNNWYATWTGLDNDYFSEISDNSTSPELTPPIDQVGTYVFYVDYFYGDFCNYTDTLVILEDPGLLLSEFNDPLLFLTVENENCQNMGDGNITFIDDLYPETLHYYWPEEINLSTDISFAENLSSGNYPVSVIDNTGRCEVFDIVINFEIDSCAKIQGFVNIDVNNNCQTDSTDHPFEMTKVTAIPTGNFAYTDTTGYFEILVPPGTYNLEREYSNPNLGTFCQNIEEIILSDPGQISPEVTIHDTIRNFIQCVSINNISVNPHLQIDENTSISIVIENCGDTLASGTFTFVNSNFGITVFPQNVPGYIYTSGDTSYFEFFDLPAFESLYIYIPVEVINLAELIGTYCYFPTNLYTDFEQQSFSVSYLILEAMIFGAYDPNDKNCIPGGYTEEHYIDIETEKLLYTIRFQNTGNYPATTVRIADTLSTMLDPSSFDLVSYSHNVVINMYDGVLDLLFPEIMLPDSGSNELESHGQITFFIDLLPDLPEFSEIQNTAYIYFDNNPAIITNTVHQTLYDCSSFNPDFNLIPPDFCNAQELQLDFEDEWIELSEWLLNGNPYSNEYFPIFTFDPGEYEIIRNIYNPLCGLKSDTLELPVYMEYPLLLDVTSNVICDANGVAISINNYSGTFSWYFNESLYSEENSLLINTPGTYFAISELQNCTLFSDTVEILDGITSPVLLSFEDNQLEATATDPYNYFYWFLNGTLVYEGSSNLYVPSESGNYSVSVVNDLGCEITSNSLTLFVEIEENLSKSHISIFPNPVESVLNIQSHLEKLEFCIYNLLGEMILSGNIQQNLYQIDTSNWPIGVYILEFSSNRKNILQTKIIVL